jgi:3-hydroxyisobutyrate dehydrogenase-like beta-hydroxyacid dehydrogenase
MNDKRNGGVLGFIGVGNMGGPMARNLLLAGYGLAVYDRDPARCAALVEEGARQVGCPCEIVPPGGTVFSMVTDDRALLEIVEGEGGLLDHLGVGGVHVSMSTVSPQVSRRLAARYAERGTHYLAATVSGRPDDAAAARLAIFYAGPAQAKQRVLPALRALGNPQALYDLGERVEAANGIKLAVNFPIPAVIVALAAAASLAEQYGVPREDFFRIFLASPMFGTGKVFHQYAGLIEQGLGARGFDVALGAKDVSLMQESAAAVGLRLPFAEEIQALLAEALARGWGGSDWAVVGQLLLGERAALPLGAGTTE